MKPTGPHARPARDITTLILKIFEANGRLILAGDRLVAPLGLTSARWQLLGAITASREQLTTADLARRIGVSRQAVQRIVHELSEENIVVLTPNPRHKRAQLIELTNRGALIYQEALALQQPWAEDLVQGLKHQQITDAITTLDALSRKLSIAPLSSARD